MFPQRYDIPHPRDSDPFVTKVWLPVNSPIVEGDQVIGVVHHVEDITDLDANYSRSEVALTHSQRADIRLVLYKPSRTPGMSFGRPSIKWRCCKSP